MTPAAPRDPNHNRPPTPKEKAMSEQIEPTDAMVDEAASALSVDANGTSLHYRSDVVKHVYLKIARIALNAALNHPDAAGLFADEDDRPWELLNGRRPRVGEEIRRDHYGITSIAVVGRLDRTGDPWTAEGALIGMLSHGTWYVRRTIQELPTEDGAQIIPAHGAIEAVRNGVTYTTVRATYDGLGRVWVGVWRGEDGHSTYEMPAENIHPDTWKEVDQ